MAWNGSSSKQLFARLRAFNFDLALDMQGLLKSSVLAAASGAKLRVGFADTREFADRFLTHRLNVGDYFGPNVPVVELPIIALRSLLWMYYRYRKSQHLWCFLCRQHQQNQL